MRFRYDGHHYRPPAPVLPVTVRIPGDESQQITIDALVDTGADLTCLPRASVQAIGAQPASTYEVLGAAGARIGVRRSFFLDFEIAGSRSFVEVIELGDEAILGRNLLNDLTIKLSGPREELEVEPN